MQADNDRMVDCPPHSVAIGWPGTLAVRPEMAQDALHIAVQIRAMHERSGHTLTLLFTPASPGTSATRIVHAIGHALVHIREAPVVVIRLKAAGSSEVCLWSDRGETILLPENMECGTPLLSYTGELAGAGLSPLPDEASLVECLCSNNVAAFLAALRNRFPYILLSGESVCQSVESLLVSSQCDGVLLTVVAGKTRLPEVRQAKSQLERSNAKVLGFIFDQSPNVD